MSQKHLRLSGESGITRRQVLFTLGTGASVAIAGCSGDDGSGSGETTDNGGDDSGETTDDGGESTLSVAFSLAQEPFANNNSWRVIAIEVSQTLPSGSTITVNPLTQDPPFSDTYTLEEEMSAGTRVYVGQSSSSPSFSIGSQDDLLAAWTGRHEGIEMEVTIETEGTSTSKTVTLYGSSDTTTEQ
jgi:hypothetical protein